MGLNEQIESDYVQAFKAGEKASADTLRLLKSEFHNAAIAKGTALTDEDTLGVVAKEVKKRKEAILAYQNAGRNDLASKEEAELAVLSTYAPPEADEGALRSRAKEFMAELESPDFGIMMAKMMGEFKGRADGALVSRIVKEELDRVK